MSTGLVMLFILLSGVCILFVENKSQKSLNEATMGTSLKLFNFRSAHSNKIVIGNC